MFNKNKWLVAILTLVLAVVFVGCSNNGDDNNSNNDTEKGSKDEKVTVNLYTSESQDLVGDMMNVFMKENTDVKVEIFRTGTEELIGKMEAERTNGSIDADMVWFADIDYFNTLDEEGLLEAYDSPNAENIKDEFKYSDGKYYE